MGSSGGPSYPSLSKGEARFACLLTREFRLPRSRLSTPYFAFVNACSVEAGKSATEVKPEILKQSADLQGNVAGRLMTMPCSVRDHCTFSSLPRRAIELGSPVTRGEPFAKALIDTSPVGTPSVMA